MTIGSKHHSQTEPCHHGPHPGPSRQSFAVGCRRCERLMFQDVSCRKFSTADGTSSRFLPQVPVRNQSDWDLNILRSAISEKLVPRS